MNYHGLPVEEFTGSKTIVYDKPKAMLCWNDDMAPAYNFEPCVLVYEPRSKRKVLTLGGSTYEHCAEIPTEEQDTSRVVTCRELSLWLKKHPYVYVLGTGRGYPDYKFHPNLCQYQYVLGKDYRFCEEDADIPCTDNGEFHVNAILMGLNTTSFAPTLDNLCYGVQYVYEPSEKEMLENPLFGIMTR